MSGAGPNAGTAPVEDLTGKKPIAATAGAAGTALVKNLTGKKPIAAPAGAAGPFRLPRTAAPC